MNKIRPKGYQQQIIDELGGLNSRALFMGTGSGKTYTSLFIHKALPPTNLLIVCPPSITQQWEASAEAILPDANVIKVPKSWSGKRINDAIATVPNNQNNIVAVSMYVVHSLDILNKAMSDDWHIIFDESHRIKSHKARVTKTMLKLGSMTKYKTILTATPTEADYGGYIDLYTQLKFLDHMDMSRMEFLNHYAIEKAMNLPGLKFPIMEITGYRETVGEIDDILKQISRSFTPAYTDEPAESIKIQVPRSPRYTKAKYQRTYSDINLSNPTRLRIAERTLTTGTIVGLSLSDKRLTYDDNTSKLDWLKDFVQDQGGVVLVYYQYNVELANLEKLAKTLNKTYIIINGANNNKIDDINHKSYDLIFGQLNACSESIDGLQHKTNIAVYFALPESSIVARQSTGRLDRMGQTLSPRFYYLIMEKTVDEKIWALVESKKDFSQKTLDMLVLQEY